MSGSLILLQLAGAVALMLFATRMVRTGVERAYGNTLRHRLRSVMNQPFMAVVTGTLLAIAFQSSTAVTLLVSSFAGSGIVSGLVGQLAVRGAEVGSALVVRLLRLDLAMLIPACFVAGTGMFMATEHRKWRQLGRILIGIGLLLLSLRLIGEASEPLRESAFLPVVVEYFSSDLVTAFLLAALVTWLFHSSIAALLLMAALADRGLMPPELGIALVLGINLGSSLIAPLLSRHASPAARTVPVGNLLMRGAGSVVVLVLFLVFRPSTDLLGATESAQMVNAHILFNVFVLIAGIPLSRWVFAASERIVAFTERNKAAAESAEMPEVSALDEAALATPQQALANATREVVGVCETVEVMLQRVMELYEESTDEEVKALARLDDRIDTKHAAIKLYLARLSARPLAQDDALHCQELISACVKLEQVGDIIVRNMLVHVRKKNARKLEFTSDGWHELTDLHASVLSNARLAFNLLISRDCDTALRLVLEKDRMRDVERTMNQNHFERLREGTERSIETSSLHLDTMRDLKQINSLLVSIAYPVLEENGLLRNSRLTSRARHHAEQETF